MAQRVPETSGQSLVYNKRENMSTNHALTSTSETSQLTANAYHENEFIDNLAGLKIKRESPPLKSVVPSKRETFTAGTHQGNGRPFETPSGLEGGSKKIMKAGLPDKAFEPTMRNDGHDTDGSDTEDELELIDLLHKKAIKKLDEKLYKDAEQYGKSECQRLSKLSTRKSKYRPRSAVCLLSLSKCQILQLKWQDALDNIELIETSDLESEEKLILLYDFLYLLTLIEADKPDVAMDCCEKTLRIRRKVFGKTHARYYEILALKVHILWLQGNLPEAEVYQDILPEGFHIAASLGRDHQSLPLSAVNLAQILQLVDDGWVASKVKNLESELGDGQIQPNPTQLTRTFVAIAAKDQRLDDIAFYETVESFVSSGRVDDLRQLVGSNIDRLWKIPTLNGKDPLLFLARSLDMVQYLDNAGADLKERDHEGSLYFTRVCQDAYDDGSIARYLLSRSQNKEELNEIDPNIKQTVLALTIFKHRVEIVKLLLSFPKPEVKLAAIGSSGNNILHYAALHHSANHARDLNLSIIKLVIEYAKSRGTLADLENEKDMFGRTPRVLFETYCPESSWPD